MKIDLYHFDFKEKLKIELKSGSVFIGNSEDFFRKEDFDSEFDELFIVVEEVVVNKGDIKLRDQLSISENEIETIEIL